mmetsp:Transcript_19314/g.21576  ORF Transcript_19314/g.21576 Transcript_19314/m.21576 type:complete len:949 (-) Transcript_19314:464-3310(-)|eukprot:CAMPEP_0194176680 /NCGR_PEP_ID=MMETSP0154-20130528/10556_1 /TAXON_ID=1049557 /ORGANISM="Thalassiothrix antarctica, Strain L6-D1" /LENGTH=948 /DNA_ID=CAMNT_0038890963 /DNA_START=72 /DNA_END=2918 /DNA_ORIENTATION=+
MWGLLEKGKEFAANIDKQLNESVGVDKTQAKTTNGKNMDDAWNDDFEDDDLFDTSKIKESVTKFSEINEEKVSDCDDAVGLGQEYIPSENDRRPTINPIESTPSMVSGELLSNQVENLTIKEPKLQEHIKLSFETKETSYQELEPQSDVTPPAESLRTQVSLGELWNQAATSKVGILDNIDESQQKTEGKANCFEDTTPDFEGKKAVLSNEKIAPVESPAVKDDSTSIAIAIEEKQDIGWENNLYDDDDDEEDDDEKNITSSGSEEKIGCKDHKKLEKVEAPPVTITIPSLDAAVAEENFHIQEEEHEILSVTLQIQLNQLQSQLQKREKQLAQKEDQIASIISVHESEKEELQSKINQTKEEAKRRIQKAKERAETIEATMAGKDLTDKDETIAALRDEGQKLAVKQSEMSRAVRAAKGETRELTFKLEEEVDKKEKALDKIDSLETELKKIKEALSLARKKEGKAVKLERELVSLKEENDRKEATNMSLQQHVKELKAENKELVKDLESIQKGTLIESKRESNKLKKEHGDILSEMEVKLRTAERDASVREDSLRQEVDELRRRWQDAVRRADTLSMDVQNSTAPLLRQLESMERQNRVRATAWAELETKLRTDLEDSVIENEKLTKECNDYKSDLNRTTRVSKERYEELIICKNLIEEQKVQLEKQETQIDEMETESRKRNEEYTEVERLANEGVSKVRSDMMKTVLESEERHQGQLKAIECDLTKEREKRILLDRQVEELLESSGVMVIPNPISSTTSLAEASSSVKKLRSAEGQADILAGAISSLDGDSEKAIDDIFMKEDQPQSAMSSFAAMEQLSQRLKESKVELDNLRTTMESSERVRASLVEELSETRVAKEKLPLFQAKVQELANSDIEKDQEISALKEDISEIRNLYRSQLNVLLEEKAATLCEASEKVQHPGSIKLNLVTPENVALGVAIANPGKC